MATVIRTITSAEVREFVDISMYVFAASRADYDRYVERGLHEPYVWARPEWSLAAFVDGTLASTLAAYPWQVRVNGRPVPAAGISAVGTRPDYRRRGLQRAVMTRALEWHREHGQAFAMLWASFGAIYQRYGYGLATAQAGYTFDPARAALREEVDHGYTVRPADWGDPEVRAVVERLYARYAAPRTLLVERDDWWWGHSWLVSFEHQQDRRVYLAIAYDAAGKPAGYIAYRTHEQPQSFEPSPLQVLETQDFVAPDLSTWRALWHFLRAHDLVREVRMGWVPEDDPAYDLLLEPRVLRRRTGDGMWLRVVDVVQALEARGYEPGADGSVVIGVRDELCPWNDGAYRVTVEAGRATVKRVRAKPSLTMPVGALASLYSGFRTATALARAGRVEGSASALRTADRLFATAYRPHVMDEF